VHLAGAQGVRAMLADAAGPGGLPVRRAPRQRS
jgi:hypothetical protein